MRILLLTFYFRPDLSAGSFRTTALVDELERRLGPADTIDVITTLPNRYSSFRVQAPESESNGKVSIFRVRVPEHQSGMIDQSKSFARYASQVWKLTKGKRYDLVFASSSRLLTAFLGATMARRYRCAYYADLRDIFTDTLSDVLPKRSPFRIALPVFRAMERYTISGADRINLVSEGFKDYFTQLDSSKEYSCFTNGIDEEFLSHSYVKEVPSGPIKVVYAGNIGASQDLHQIIPGMASALGSKYEILVVGDGGAKAQLEHAIVRENLHNVSLHPPVPREKLLELYAEADILFLHLGRHNAFLKVLPSKLFEYAATGKPILAGVSGYAERFVTGHIENAAVFKPGDVQQCVDAVSALTLAQTPRDDFVERYRRRTIICELADDFLRLAHKAR